MTIQWFGIAAMQNNLDRYGDKVIAAVEQVAIYLEPILEGYAKTEARWTDRTGNARQSLHTWHDVANDIVTVYIGHGVEYGIWLEVRWAGRYSIIWPTIEAHLVPIARLLDGIFN